MSHIAFKSSAIATFLNVLFVFSSAHAEENPLLEQLKGMECGVLSPRDLWKQIGNDSLHEMSLSSSLGIALPARWEMIRRTFLDHDRKQSKPIDRRKLERFAGYIEGRLEIELPSWWENRLVRLRYFDDLVLSVPIKIDPRFEYRITDAGISIPSHITSINRVNDELKAVIGGRDYIIPKDAVSHAEDAITFLDAVNIIVIDDRRFAAAVHLDTGASFPLFFIDSASKKTLWSTDVCALQPILGNSGTHHVEITVTGDTLYVFGSTYFAMYIEAFAIKDGKSVFRFSTAF